MRMNEFLTIAMMLLIMFMMQGCGRKGPLYLPQVLPPVVVAPVVPASAPAPAAPLPASAVPSASSSTSNQH